MISESDDELAENQTPRSLYSIRIRLGVRYDIRRNLLQQQQPAQNLQQNKPRETLAPQNLDPQNDLQQPIEINLLQNAPPADFPQNLEPMYNAPV